MEEITKNSGRIQEVCIIRFLCNLENLSRIFDVINYLGLYGEKSTSFYNPQNFTIEFSKNEGKKKIEENKIKDSCLEDFRRANKSDKFIRWEPMFVENDDSDDVVYFQYFLLILKYLAKENYGYEVKISAGYDAKNKEYSVLEYSGKWSRLRTFLYLYSDNELSKIFIYSKIKEATGWRQIKDKDTKSSIDFGKIFPLLPINAATYNALINTSCINKEQDELQDEWQIKIHNLYYSYKDRILIEINSEYGEKFENLKKLEATYKDSYKEEVDAGSRGDEKFEQLKKNNSSLMEQIKQLRFMLTNDREAYLPQYKNDSLLEGIIFVATLFYLGEVASLTESQLTELHEICVDYAQGVAQLIENIIYHVIGNETEESGCGSFTIRVRERKDAFYLNEDAFKDINKFMEIYVADYNYKKFGGFVNRFLSNVADRGDKWADSLTVNNVQLQHLFGENLEKEMKKYFEDGTNIAMHYGLQIFNNVVKTNDGCLYMTSGACNDKDKNNTFFSENYVGNDDKKGYIAPELFWGNGTAYIVYLPIKSKTNNINYTDAVAESNIDICESEAIKLSLVLSVNRQYNLTAEDKNSCIECIRKSIEEQINKNKIDSNDCIYFIDFKEFYEKMKEVPFNKFEVLAKALFLLFAAETMGTFKNVAIVNLGEEYDVIRMFRQFALFYNRVGKSKNMKGKSVFLVDDLGQFDIFIYGEDLASIEMNLAYGQIYGGYSDTAMTIINHISRGQNE